MAEQRRDLTARAIDTPAPLDTAGIATVLEKPTPDGKQDISAAIAAYNERIEREGLFGEEHRRF